MYLLLTANFPLIQLPYLQYFVTITNIINKNECISLDF